MKDIAKQECEEGMFRKGELPGRFTARKLFGWSNKRYDQEYWGSITNGHLLFVMGALIP